MVHSFSNRMIAAAGLAVVAAAKRSKMARQRKRALRKLKAAKRVLLLTFAYSCIDGYRTPRPGGYLRVDHPDGPAGSWWRQLKLARRNGAFVRFLGVTVDMFDKIVHAAEPYYIAASTGRPRWLDAADITAMGLRRLQTFGPQYYLEPEFGMTRSATNVYLNIAERVLHDAMASIHEARLGFPPYSISKLAFEGVQAQWGRPPKGTLGAEEIIDYLIDGSTTPGFSCSDLERQQLFTGKDGVI